MGRRLERCVWGRVALLVRAIVEEVSGMRGASVWGAVVSATPAL